MLHHLDTSPLINNIFSDATSTRQFLMTVRLYYFIDICPEKHLIRVDLYLSKKVFSQYITSEIENQVGSRK